MQPTLSDDQRKAIHDLALAARAELTRRTRELLEGVYGLYADGRLEPAEKLPQVRADPEARTTHARLALYLHEEERAGVPRAEAVEKLVKEVAFTHLNRLVAFKMMEARGLIRETVSRGPDSNAFKFYLADHPEALARYAAGDVDAAYRSFLLWQAGEVAREIKVLFDPASLPSRLFPTPPALAALLDLINRPALDPLWQADETVGWIYQFFNEPELQAAFEKVRTSSAKFEAGDIPSATQLFTPGWIVRFLVHNTLGRLWVDLHPDTRLRGTPALDYLIPAAELPAAEAAEAGPPRLARSITLLDPACGTMHFGLVACDLFAEIYREELERAGEPGWPERPSVADPAAIPGAILAHNLFGIDIDLRAVQLAALALYLKAKRLAPETELRGANLAVADVTPLNGGHLGAFVREAHFERPIYERLMRALWERLQDVGHLGSLLRLEQEMGALVAEERAAYREAPLFAGLPGTFEAEAGEDEFWEIVSAQIVQGLDEFARQQARRGADQTFFAGEATKGLRLLDLMLRRYDVVVTNPPYLSRRKMGTTLRNLLSDAYPEGKSDFYAAFIERCLELAEEEGGHVGMLTMHSFMFISSYEDLRQKIRSQAAIRTVAHLGPGLFEVGNPGTLQTVAFCLRREPDPEARAANAGTYLRLVHEPTGDAKRCAFEAARSALAEGAAPPNVYRVAQRAFDAIPGAPWVYWIPESLRALFATLPALGDVAQPRQGLATADNFRFLRLWWEVGRGRVARGCPDAGAARATGRRWFPCMKGGRSKQWYGNQEHVVNWHADGKEIQNFYKSGGRLASRPQNTDYYFREGITWSLISSTQPGFRWMPEGWIITHKGPGIFFDGSLNTLYCALKILNSKITVSLLLTVSPTLGFEIGQLAILPWVTEQRVNDIQIVFECIWLNFCKASLYETTCDFAAPARWAGGLEDLAGAEGRLAALQAEIDAEVYRLYGIADADRAAIEAELAGEPLAGDEEEEVPGGEDDDEAVEPPMDAEELAVRWIAYAVGVVLGRFRPGVPGALGSALYRRADFAVGSLPAPGDADFDELVGPPERFAYVDAEGGRHLFPAEVEAALRATALPDGIALLDTGHPRDLPALVAAALDLMLGAAGAREVIAVGAGGDLRKFLERDFFTRWHARWYSKSRRKAPVYWPLQSARRSYGCYLFHERIDHAILHTLLRDYVDVKLNALRLQIGDAEARLEGLEGSARKRAAREIAERQKVLAEVQDFARTMEAILEAGYEPAPAWIDDGVILRMAPLWELIPIWKSEPKKYWARLQKGQYDWSHVAMHYWPERVRAACRENKSFAIAHGHPEWYAEDEA